MNFILLALSGFAFIWGAFCLLGGPDGNIGSLESIIWGGSFIVAGFLLLAIRKSASKKAKDNNS